MSKRQGKRKNFLSNCLVSKGKALPILLITLFPNYLDVSVDSASARPDGRERGARHVPAILAATCTASAGTARASASKVGERALGGALDGALGGALDGALRTCALHQSTVNAFLNDIVPCDHLSV